MLPTMFRPRFVLPEFNANNREIANQYLRVLLDSLVSIAVIYFRTHPAAPRLYGGKFRYIREDPTSRDDQIGPEDWQSPAETIKRGGGDCEDLAAYRVGELIVFEKIPAFAQFFWKDRPDNGSTYHIVVQHKASGKIEDPSKQLGMGRRI